MLAQERQQKLIEQIQAASQPIPKQKQKKQKSSRSNPKNKQGSSTNVPNQNQSSSNVPNQNQSSSNVPTQNQPTGHISSAPNTENDKLSKLYNNIPEDQFKNNEQDMSRMGSWNTNSPNYRRPPISTLIPSNSNSFDSCEYWNRIGTYQNQLLNYYGKFTLAFKNARLPVPEQLVLPPENWQDYQTYKNVKELLNEKAYHVTPYHILYYFLVTYNFKNFYSAVNERSQSLRSWG